MASKSTKEKGNRGEDLACEFLRSKGYTINKRNWRFGKYEVDIIAEHDNTLVFIEVKFRFGHPALDPVIEVTQKQRYNLIKVANFFIEINSIDRESRFDILEIVDDRGKAIFHHCVDAFTPDVNQV